MEENDSVKILFDKLNLIKDFVDLYDKIGVKITVIDSNIEVSEIEKQMITNILEKKLFKKNEDINVRTILIDIILHVKSIQVFKNRLNNFNLLIIPKEVYLIEEQINQETTQEIIKKNDDNSPLLSLVKNINTVKKNEKEEIGQYLTLKDKPEPFDKYYFNYSRWDKNKIISTLNSYCILYNIENECSLICYYSQKIKAITDEFDDFILLREYKDIPDKNIDILKDLIKNNMYCEKIEIEKKLDAFELLYDIKKINEKDNEKSFILFYIKENYIISDDVTKRIKVSVLLEEVERELKITNTNLRHDFANYLFDIGLKKKRYSDGMYLYGIESKTDAKINNLIKNKLTKNDFDKFIKSRESEFNTSIKIDDKRNNF